jgi:hypothetical protein
MLIRSVRYNYNYLLAKFNLKGTFNTFGAPLFRAGRISPPPASILKFSLLMNVKFLRLLQLVLASVLLGVVISYSLFFLTETLFLTGGLLFSAFLLLFLVVQVRQLQAEQ